MDRSGKNISLRQLHISGQLTNNSLTTDQLFHQSELLVNYSA